MSSPSSELSFISYPPLGPPDLMEMGLKWAWEELVFPPASLCPLVGLQLSFPQLHLTLSISFP